MNTSGDAAEQVVRLSLEGVEVAARLGRDMAWMVKVLSATRETLPPPESFPRTMTNFIR